MKEYGTVQINIPQTIARYVVAMREAIPDEDLAGENKHRPHITLCWGILNDDPKAVWDAVVLSMPFYIRFGKTRIFPPSESSNNAAVVYVEVFSPYMKLLHQRIKEKIPTQPSEHEYSPHCTVAFVKPEVAHEYENNPALDGMEFMATYVNMTNKQGIQRTIHIHPYRVE